MKRRSLLVLLASLALAVLCNAATDAEAEAAAYWAVVTGRADKIVAVLALDDKAKVLRVRDLVAGYYRDLRDVHETRDTALARARADGVSADEAALARVREEADLRLFRVHTTFVARLSVELEAGQVEAVKDGLTYGVVPNTWRVYREMYPELSDEQRRQILAWLVEAREYAMQGGSSHEKHAWFGKYKGRIANFLSAAGYDAKAAEKQWFERQRTGKTGTP
ncbi:DUF3826 domain-containing protein [Opitutales bacterium ASA1]|uniref:DUF3826 domain-containing protein n=1 Tax=Congregicoccus parvus TaxID=3081749 RepID=UPI002B322FF2|nr:DUF3826 domain-containing protein [Opitutales bacterium ASA1]